MKISDEDIQIELGVGKVSKSVANLLSYVEAGHYSHAIFYRVVDGFMIQGGGFHEQMERKSAPDTIENEATNGLMNKAGSVAKARTMAPHNAGAHFFINVNDNTFPDHPGKDGWSYCVFGEVTEGMDVVSSIKGVRTGNNGSHQNVPLAPVIIHEVVE